jgi:hypothetical protein
MPSPRHRLLTLAAVGLSLSLVAGACGGGGGAPIKPKTTANRIARSEAILTDLVKGKFSDVTKGFDSQLKAALPLQTITDTWNRYVNDFGAYKSHGKSSEVTVGANKVDDVPLVMAKIPGVLRVGYNLQGETTGLFLLKTGVPVGSEGAPGTPTPAAEAAAVTVIEQMRTGAFDALAATFDSSMAANASADSIRKAWEGATGQFGNWVNTGKGLVVPVTGAVLYDLPVTLEKGTIHVQVVVDPDVKIAGLSIRSGPPTGKFGS